MSAACMWRLLSSFMMTRLLLVSVLSRSMTNGMRAFPQVSGTSLGAAAVDIFAALTFGLDEWRNLAQESAAAVPSIKSIMDEQGLELLLWSDEFTEALELELKESDMLEELMTPELLTQSLKGKGMILGADLPGLKKSKIVTAQVLAFEAPSSTSRVARYAHDGVQVQPRVKALVDKLLGMLSVPSLLQSGSAAVGAYLKDSSLLRRACTPARMAAVLKGMGVSMSVLSPLALRLKAEVLDLSLAKDGEARTCLADVAPEALRVEERSERLAFKTGLLVHFARGIGVDGFRYMVRKIRPALMDFLKTSNAVPDALGAPLLQRVLGALKMKIKIDTSTGVSRLLAAKSVNVVSIKCVCKDVCPAFESAALDNPLFFQRWGGQGGYRCPRVNVGGSQAPMTTSDSVQSMMPCCANSEEKTSVCVDGIGHVMAYEAMMRSCKLLGKGWAVGQRCMPSNPVLEVKCSAGVCTKVGYSKPTYGIPESLSHSDGYRDSSTELVAFDVGRAAARLSLGVLLGEASSRQEVTQAMGRLMGSEGFDALVNGQAMRDALTYELWHGTLLADALSVTKLTDVMAGFALKLELPVMGLSDLTIERFEPTDLDNNSHVDYEDKNMAAHIRSTPQYKSALALMSNFDMSILLRHHSCGYGEDGSCVLTDALIFALRQNGILIDNLRTLNGQLLNRVLVAKRLKLSSSVFGWLDVTISNFEVVTRGKLSDTCLQSIDDPHVDVLVRDGTLNQRSLGTFISSFRKDLVSRFEGLFGTWGLFAILGAMRKDLLESMARKDGILAPIMTESFVRELLIGSSITSTLNLAKGNFGMLLPIKTNLALPVCAVTRI
eukprot:TRINITY_DN28138_c1_g2_i1.p1 TRINITY_DN28138_c1_g2~~TRINITY_DN28138_c1_g2_i1.p1  ORF type:complete len:835 (+),score=127.22 TRINITY_DN28138_c1_g2_i1:40-2544(+)